METKTNDNIEKIIKENNRLLYLIIQKLNEMSSDDAKLSEFIRSIGANLFSNIINDKIIGSFKS